MNNKPVLWIILKYHTLRTYLLLLMLFLFFYNGVLQAQWVQTNCGGGGYVEYLGINEGKIFASSNLIFYSSTDEGTNWTYSHSISGHVYALTKYGNNLLVGTDYGIWISSNNGSNWESFGLAYYRIYAITVIGTNVLAGTDLVGMVLTTNNGTDWVQINNGLTELYFSTYAVIDSNIFVGTWNSGVFLSTNMGNSWTPVNSGLTNKSVWFLTMSGNNIFAATNGGVFLSKNNGMDWNSVNNGLTCPYISSLAVSGNNIFAGTRYGGVFLSTNNGENWTQVNNGLTGTEIRPSLIISNNYIYAGTGAGVWKRPLSELVGVTKEVTKLPKQFAIAQNYPNPFNPVTTINYSLAKEGNVRLIVYNSLGSKVTTIVNEYKQAGNYSVRFDGSNLASGIYFYILETEKFSQIKKMVLIK